VVPVLLRRLVIVVDRAVLTLWLLLLLMLLMLLLMLLMLLVLLMLMLVLLILLLVLLLLVLLLPVLWRRPGSPPGVHVVGATAVGKPAASSSSSSPAAAGIGPAGHADCTGFSASAGTLDWTNPRKIGNLGFG
jgi:hypothetical protein